MMRVAGRGPLGWSTTREIALASSGVCWDTNGYYRRLGIPYPYVHATRRAIREAFLARGGPNDASLTQAFIVLINDREKAIYDSTPLGDKYFDPDVRIERKRAALSLEHRLRTEGTLEEMLAEGKVVPLDNAEGEGETDGVPAKDRYPYSVLLLDTESYDDLVLLEWQRILLEVIHEDGGPDRIGLGVAEGHGLWVQGDVMGTMMCIFDRWATPSRTVARRIIASHAG